MSLHFSDAEMARRKALLAKTISESGVDAMLLFKQESMYWLTGYDTFGFSLFQCMIVDGDGNITLFTRRPDLLQARHTSDVENIHIWVDREGVDPGQELVALLRELGCAGKTLGIEMQSYGLTAANWVMLEKSLKDFCQYEDQTRLVDELRIIKSDEELDCSRRAAALSDDALDEARRLAGPGAWEGDILAGMQGAVFKGGGDYAGNEFILGSGPGAMLVRYFSGRRHMTEGDQLTLEFSGAYARYHAAMMRTILTGPVDPHHEKMFAATSDALTACRDALQPGRLMGDVFDAYANTCDNHGYEHARFNACGYGMSAIFNPLWVDPPMFYHGNPLPIRPGSVFFLHMIIMDEPRQLAMTLGESYIITETGNERLSRSDLDLIVR